MNILVTRGKTVVAQSTSGITSKYSRIHQITSGEYRCSWMTEMFSATANSKNQQANFMGRGRRFFSFISFKMQNARHTASGGPVI